MVYQGFNRVAISLKADLMLDHVEKSLEAFFQVQSRVFPGNLN